MKYAYEVRIDYLYIGKRKFENHSLFPVSTNDGMDVWSILRMLSKFSWLERADSVDIKFDGDQYEIAIKTQSSSYLKAVRVYIRRPMSVSAS